MSSRGMPQEGGRGSSAACDDLVQHMPVALQTSRLDPDGDFTLVRANRAATAMVGFDLSARVGDKLSAIFPSATPDRFAKYREVALGGEPFVEPQRVYVDDTIRGAFDLHAFNSGPGEVTVVFLNVTDRLRKEELQARYRQLFDDAPDMMAAVVPETGVIRECNHTLANVLGEKPESVIGRHIADIHHPTSRDAVERALETLVTMGQVPPIELMLLSNRGDALDVSLKVSAIRDADGSVVRGNWVWRDITEPKRATAELHHLERENTDLARFAYIASHDLQEPLRAVVNFGKVLERELHQHELPAAVYKHLGFITDGAQQMQGLIWGLLEYSRLGHRREPQRVDARDVLRQVLAELRGQLERSGGEVFVRPLPILTADPVEIAVVLRNLIGNGLKFVRPGEVPRVTVGASRGEANEVVLWVEDQGIGLSEGAEQRIFEMFRRLHPRSEYAGHGVGLALCRRFAELNGGRIWVERNTKGGCTFRVGLPAAMLHEEDSGEWG